MTWIQTHLVTILTVWGTVWALASAVAPQLPPTSFLGKTAHVIVALSPLDVVKAWKAIGSSMIPPTTLLVLSFGLLKAWKAIGVFVSMVVAIALLANCSASQQAAELQDAKLVGKDAVCILEHFGANVGNGQGDAIAIVNAAIACGTSQLHASTVANAHRRAMISEGFVPAPQPGDAGRD